MGLKFKSEGEDRYSLECDTGPKRPPLLSSNPPYELFAGLEDINIMDIHLDMTTIVHESGAVVRLRGDHYPAATDTFYTKFETSWKCAECGGNFLDCKLFIRHLIVCLGCSGADLALWDEEELANDRVKDAFSIACEERVEVVARCVSAPNRPSRYVLEAPVATRLGVLLMQGVAPREEWNPAKKNSMIAPVEDVPFADGDKIEIYMCLDELRRKLKEHLERKEDSRDKDTLVNLRRMCREIEIDCTPSHQMEEHLTSALRRLFGPRFRHCEFTHQVKKRLAATLPDIPISNIDSE